MNRYVLDLHREPIPFNRSIVEHGRWLECTDLVVRETLIDSVIVETRFLGVDHAFRLPGPPALFETMVIGSDWVGWRYATRLQAMIGHRKIVKSVRQHPGATASEFLAKNAPRVPKTQVPVTCGAL